MNTVLVFGVFDRLHPGHKAFLKEARDLGDRLVVSLARDSVVKALKGREPEQTFKVRKQALLDLEIVDDVLEGDEELGAYSCLSSLQPSTIAFGYDQQKLQQDCETFLSQQGADTTTVVLSPFDPHLHKSSLNRSL